MIIKESGVEFEQLDVCPLCSNPHCEIQEKMKMKVGLQILIMDCPDFKETSNGSK